MRWSLWVAVGATVALAGCATTAEANQGDGKDCPVCAPCEAEKCPEKPAKTARKPFEAKASSVSAKDPRTLKFRAFSMDNQHAAIEVSDDRGGSFLEIVKLDDASVVKTYRFDPASHKAVWKKARKVHKLLQRAPTTAAHPKDEAMTLMGSDGPGWAIANLAKGERVLPYYRIPRLDEAGVAFKTLAFSPDGKWIAIVHTQTLLNSGVEVPHDFFHTAKYYPFRAPLD